MKIVTTALITSHVPINKTKQKKLKKAEDNNPLATAAALLAWSVPELECPYFTVQCYLVQRQCLRWGNKNYKQ